MKFLIVEDEDILSRALTRFFSSQGWEVMRVSDGSEAIDAIESYKPDVVLLDIYLPGKNGFDVLTECHVRYPGIIFVTMTGSPREEDYARSTSLGAVTCLKKPFKIEYLRNVMDLASKINIINGAKRELRPKILPVKVSKAVRRLRSRFSHIHDFTYWTALFVFSIATAIAISFWPIYGTKGGEAPKAKEVDVKIEKDYFNFSSGAYRLLGTLDETSSDDRGSSADLEVSAD
ncbi:MAG: hypothetical protein CVV64_16480 [Candidatus Wallbacteria bacterium HGW-Wallbacteria-1]|jgi:CheY-like chemotaxis protein|uniref:Response regulatory domain-containing protein n=1 Tax=Candidatus Wallbacteria bacterium HGW-Wallbacteria-1 TaxID=2013854 RepID=A0A2N1PKV2_9BACT|nr:MAG: hypothetical protein CVV64_16480 [Candidatus Wallbacteria bacterium HGW-Wallbacteria-1]